MAKVVIVKSYHTWKKIHVCYAGNSYLYFRLLKEKKIVNAKLGFTGISYLPSRLENPIAPGE